MRFLTGVVPKTLRIAIPCESLTGLPCVGNLRTVKCETKKYDDIFNYGTTGRMICQMNHVVLVVFLWENINFK